jgi:hypothetical protein
LLAHIGRAAEAAHLGSVFDVVEGRLVDPQPSEGADSSLGS